MLVTWLLNWVLSDCNSSACVMFVCPQWWNVEKGEALQTFYPTGANLKRVHISPDFSTFVTIDSIGILYILKKVEWGWDPGMLTVGILKRVEWGRHSRMLIMGNLNLLLSQEWRMRAKLPKCPVLESSMSWIIWNETVILLGHNTRIILIPKKVEWDYDCSVVITVISKK